jgi:hypothetical protein
MTAVLIHQFQHVLARPLLLQAPLAHIDWILHPALDLLDKLVLAPQSKWEAVFLLQLEVLIHLLVVLLLLLLSVLVVDY